MNLLLEQLRTLDWIPEKEIQTAIRRRDIYGASLDTNLMELELLTIRQTDELLSLSTGLPMVSKARLFSDEERPWTRIPESSSFLRWIAPLHYSLGTLEVAVHPEIPEDEFARLRATLPRAELFVLPECSLVHLQMQPKAYSGSPRLQVLERNYRELKHDSYNTTTTEHMALNRIAVLDRALDSSTVSDAYESIERCDSIAMIIDRLVEALSVLAKHGTLFRASTPTADYDPFRSFGIAVPPNNRFSAPFPLSPNPHPLHRSLLKPLPVQLNNLDLRLAVSREDAIPCLFVPLRFPKNDMLVYLDQEGESFSIKVIESIYLLINRAVRRAKTLETTLSATPLPLDQAIQDQPPKSGRHLDGLKRQTARPAAVTEAIESRSSAPVPPPRRRLPRQRPAPQLESNPSVPGKGNPDELLLPEGPLPEQSSSRMLLDDDSDAVRESEKTLAEIDKLLDRTIEGGEALTAAQRANPSIRKRIIQRFPGPLRLVGSNFDDLPPLAEHGRLIEITLNLEPAPTGELLPLLHSPSAIVRFYAAAMFHPLRDERVVPDLARLVFDFDSGVRTVAARVLETYAGSRLFRHALSSVRRELLSSDVARQRDAIVAVGSLRDAQSVPRLIDLLSGTPKDIRELALQALASITAQRLGPSQRGWATWYEENQDFHRITWLIDGLSIRDPKMQAWIDAELHRITDHDFDESPSLEESASSLGSSMSSGQLQKHWSQWWENEGQYLDIR